jgi:hypothetical protein
MRKVGLVVVLLAGACAAPAIRPLHPDEIAVAPYHSAVKEQLVGSLLYENGCLLFTNEDRSRQLLPVWPAGSEFQESMLTFHQPAKAEQRVIVGEEVRLDGEAGDWSQLDPRLYAPFRHQCAAQPFFVSDVTPAN